MAETNRGQWAEDGIVTVKKPAVNVDGRLKLRCAPIVIGLLSYPGLFGLHTDVDMQD